MKRKVLSAFLIAAMTLSMAACGGGNGGSDSTGGDSAPAADEAEDTDDAESAGDADSGELITVGYAQVGAESDWRTANTDISLSSTMLSRSRRTRSRQSAPLSSRKLITS